MQRRLIDRGGLDTQRCFERMLVGHDGDSDAVLFVNVHAAASSSRASASLQVRHGPGCDSRSHASLLVIPTITSCPMRQKLRPNMLDSLDAIGSVSKSPGFFNLPPHIFAPTFATAQIGREQAEQPGDRVADVVMMALPLRVIDLLAAARKYPPFQRNELGNHARVIEKPRPARTDDWQRLSVNVAPVLFVIVHLDAVSAKLACDKAESPPVTSDARDPVSAQHGRDLGDRV